MPKRIALFLGLAGCCAALAYAMNATITWDLPPTPTVANISAGDSVTWNGNFDFHPLLETDASFTQFGTLVNGTGVSYSKVFAAPGTYYYMCGVHGAQMPTTVNVAAPCPTGPFATLDIDANGAVEALTDGVMLIRYFLGVRGDALTAGALGNCASRTLAADSEGHIAAHVVP
jgi:hypothetical protein